MNRLSGWIQRQCEQLLQNRQYAMFCVALLACMPYTVWLAVVLVALIVLRKGIHSALPVFVIAMVMHGAFLLLSLPPAMAVISTLLTFLPCVVAANALRLTSSWQGVASAYFVLILIVMVGLQWGMPDIAMVQYKHIQLVLRQMSQGSPLWDFLNGQHDLNELLLANYLLGGQAAGVVFSATFSLMLARLLQSRLYYPGGFRREMLQFRAYRTGLFILAGVWLAASRGNLLAANLLPGILLYFLLAGVSLTANVLMSKQLLAPLFVGVALFALLMLLPFILLPICIILGVLDSLFNLRVYLPADAGNRT